ncbi:MAG: hypothetical protein ABI288_00785 [Ginsengibacter sp.]
MWTLITDCGKQLTIHSKVREKQDAHIIVYQIVEVESDQYKLKVIERNNLPAAQDVQNKLSCLQLKKYAFEVEQKG